MLGTPECDELRGYLDVKVPSISRKKGLLINLKAWRKRWLVVRRFLVSSPLAMDEGAILGRRIELKLTGDDSGNSAAPCPVVVVEEWQEDALVCPTKSRSHPYAFGLFPQPGCDPVLFLSGRTAEESRRWLVSIRSLLVPPFRPCSYRLSSISSSTGEDVDGPFHHSSPLSSSPETYQSRCVPRSQHVCFPPLPPLPSRCRLRRRSSLESLTAPVFLMDRRRSLSDSELPNSTVSEHRHHRRKCQTISSKAIDADTSRNEYLMEDYDHHIYAGIGDSGVCSSMSNVSRSFLSSSSSSSFSSSSGLYTYASPSSSGFTSYLRGNELEVAPAETSSQVSSKGDDPSLLTGKVASSLVTAGIGLMLSTPVHLDGVTDLHNAAFQRENSSAEEQLLRHLQGNDQHEEADMDRRESITSGIYEEIQEDEQSLDKSKSLIPEPSMQAESSQGSSPPPLPPRSPSQCFHLLSGRQRELAWFLGVHRNSNSCPASDVEDEELSRESSPVNGQDNDEVIMPRRKISEPSGNIPVQEQTRTATIGYSRRRRKNLESFLGVMEFGSKAKEINKAGANLLNKSLGALELVPRSEKDYADKEGKIRKRTYTEISRHRLDNVKFQETHRSSSAGALLSRDIVIEVPQAARGAEKSEDYLHTKANAKIEKEETRCEKYDSQDNTVKNLPTVIPESKDFRCSLFDNEKIERCHSFSCSLQANKVDSSDKRDQSPRSPRSIAKRLQMMKKPNLMKLILKEQTKQQELPSLRDKTKQVINRSLETLGWLGLATSQFEDSHCNVVVGGSSFYRSATCSGVDFQTERQNAQRRGAAAKVYKDRGKANNVEKLERQKSDTNATTSSCTTESMEEKLDIPSSINLLEGSAICSYHKSQLKKMDCGIGQTLEDIERLAKQELICEQICNMKMEDNSHYIPMRPLKKDRDEVIFGSKDLKIQSECVMPEEDYISMEGMTASTCKMDKSSYRESFDPGESSMHSSAYRNDAEIYMPMDGRKSTQEELAQRELTDMYELSNMKGSTTKRLFISKNSP